MTNREAIEYIERECQTCKGFYAPENECIAVPQDCFESKRLAISALEREARKRCRNISYHPGIDFICSNCRLIIADCVHYKKDDLGSLYRYRFKYNYCPKCGKRVINNDV